MALGISLPQLPAKASPAEGVHSEDHATKKKIDPVKQAVDLFHDLHIDKGTNAFDLVTPPPKNQGLSSRDAQNTGLYKDKQKVLLLNIPAELPEHRMKDKLIIFFQSCRNGGGEIVDLQYPSRIAGSAIITFADAKVAERVVQQGHHLFTYDSKVYPVELKFCNENDEALAENDTGNSISTVDIVHGFQNWQELPSIPVDPSKEKSELFQRLLSTEDQNFSVEDVMEVVQSGLNYESALRYLSHECPICSEHVSFSRVVTMTHCSCSFCENCFKNYFSSVIKEQSIVNVVCPLCKTPNLKSHQVQEDITEYFNFLDIQIRHYLDEKTHELFQRKLRDRTLMEMPNFRWCAHCSFGLLHDLNRLRMDCPSCNKSTCFQCKIPWEQQHEGISCEQFRMWKQQNNPEYQASALDIYLSKNGIECPNCRAQFDLSRGGCMHFNCQECQYQFCGGCRRPFKLGSACSFMVNCLTKGFHAHHPRNCFYYLRDWSVERLKQLLTMGNVPLTAFIADNSLGQVEGKCKVMEQRETSQGLKDEQCGQPSVQGYTGFCNIHLKQHLVELMNRNNLDPAVLYSKDEILMELQRWNISVPNQHINEPEEQFTQRLRNKIMNELKLDNQQTVFTKNSGLLASHQSNVL
ncbi:E3 ubiquitin-protein ligase RNF31-like isoform X2 [Pristis pectinata]|uniref:E3 ubiquitin-protein ligase RNF31-like isoform X2 n=1 Tax=Pristis pectinata TaxID=685728 RepID=UPI00223E8839|nr:E3 ubiquitin-protein ligase RNF31-like isoform X2 [Pristis pectinata]